MVSLRINHIELFKQFLDKENIKLQEKTLDDGSTVFYQDLRLENDMVVRCALGLSPENQFIDIFCLSVAGLITPANQMDGLYLVNKLNSEYRYAKFMVEDNGAISIKYSFEFKSYVFDTETVMNHYKMLMHIAHTEFNKFKLQKDEQPAEAH